MRWPLADFKGIMNIGIQKIVPWMLICIASFTACSRGVHDQARSADLYKEVLARLGAGAETALHAAAAVHTPEGLWNVYILSAPPDRMVFRQSRQDAEIEFGLTDEYIWREDMLTGQSRALSSEWNYFIRSYEVFRLGSQLSRWRLAESQSNCKEIVKEKLSESDLCLVDESGSRILVTITDERLPSRIIRELPAVFGGGLSVIRPLAWTRRDEELLMTGFDQEHGTDSFRWDIQSVEKIPEHEISINPPATLK